MTTNRAAAIVLWGLAILLPGGLPLMALWLSMRAARQKALLAKATSSVASVASSAATAARTSVIPQLPAAPG